MLHIFHNCKSSLLTYSVHHKETPVMGKNMYLIFHGILGKNQKYIWFPKQKPTKAIRIWLILYHIYVVQKNIIGIVTL